MVDTPNIGAPLWAAAQASPWLVSNESDRIWDAFAVVVIVDEMDRVSPPGSCADGARYLISGAGSGDWATHGGELAIAVGTNASNGWLFADIAQEEMRLYNRESQTGYRYRSGAWHEFADGLSRLQEMLDVDLTGLADGYILRWDASNGVFYPAPEWSEPEWALNFSDDGDVYIPAKEAMTISGGVGGAIGSGNLAYEKSTSAAPGTFASTSLPATLQRGAWLKVSATSVTGFLAVHLRRTA